MPNPYTTSSKFRGEYRGGQHPGQGNVRARKFYKYGGRTYFEDDAGLYWLLAAEMLADSVNSYDPLYPPYAYYNYYTGRRGTSLYRRWWW